jgi:hypothetical protein
MTQHKLGRTRTPEKSVRFAEGNHEARIEQTLTEAVERLRPARRKELETEDLTEPENLLKKWMQLGEPLQQNRRQTTATARRLKAELET